MLTKGADVNRCVGGADSFSALFLTPCITQPAKSLIRMLLSFFHNEQEMDESFRLARLRLRAASSLLPTRPATAGLCLIFRFRCSAVTWHRPANRWSRRSWARRREKWGWYSSLIPTTCRCCLSR
jgi:hypothetical protein